MNSMHLSTTTTEHYNYGGAVTRTPAASIQKRRAVTHSSIKRGRWERWEKVAFLKGLRKYGKGKWKLIGSLIPTRTTVQVKTHAQVVLKRVANGENIFESLYYADDDSTDLSASSVVGTTSQLTPWSSPKKTSTIMASKPRKALHMTPDNRDVAAAEVLANLHAPAYNYAC